MKTAICAALIAFVMTCLAPIFTSAAPEGDIHSAHAMLPYCRLSAKQTMANTRNALMYGQCFGMISGIVTMTEVLRQAQAAGKAELNPALCVAIPGDTTILQLVDTVVKYGDSHPDQAHEQFEIVAFNALRDAWPCQK